MTPNKNPAQASRRLIFRRVVVSCLLCLFTACLVLGFRWYSYIRTIQRLSAITQDYWHAHGGKNGISEFLEVVPEPVTYVGNIGFTYQGSAALKDWLGEDVSCILCGTPKVVLLTASHFSKEHIPDIEKLPTVVGVDLQDCHTISDTDLRLLCKLRQLKWMLLDGCENLSDECLLEMSSKYPDLKLIWTPKRAESE